MDIEKRLTLYYTYTEWLYIYFITLIKVKLISYLILKVRLYDIVCLFDASDDYWCSVTGLTSPVLLA